LFAGFADQSHRSICDQSQQLIVVDELHMRGNDGGCRGESRMNLDVLVFASFLDLTARPNDMQRTTAAAGRDIQHRKAAQREREFSEACIHRFIKRVVFPTTRFSLSKSRKVSKIIDAPKRGGYSIQTGTARVAQFL